MIITIDPGAGPCFGVQNAIDKAEEVLKENTPLVCMGDLIHNEAEISRLSELGMQTFSINEVLDQKPQTVLFRAHGEPPESYEQMMSLNINILDATCPIVLNLQKKIKETHQLLKNSPGQIVIYGNRSHAEVISLLGNCKNSAIIIENIEDVDKLDLSKPIYLFSQTTKYRSTYLKIRDEILKRMVSEKIDSTQFHFFESSCKMVARRDVQLQDFIKDKDLLIFVSGSKSSNGHQLYQICQASGIESHFISHAEEVKAEWFPQKKNIGISGATSTPKWLLEEVEQQILKAVK